jgi:2-keto-4-pentenoate hydratase/2-oxohepta-3-ene-1,7-dioic acid hydratase in catechol pathway
MRVLRFRRRGVESFGLVVDGGVADLARRFPRLSWVESLMLRSTEEFGATSIAADYGLDEIEYLLPIALGAKIICIGRNYPRYHEVAAEGRPKWPSVFARFPSSFAAHRQPIVRPEASEQLDYEGELCIVVGERVRHVHEEHALEHVAGYTIMNEGSVRDWQRYGSQNCPGKNFWRSGSLGPWVVTRDEVTDPTALTIQTRIDGETRQRASTHEMLFGIGELIRHVSRFTWLEPGDVIATGSPGGSAADSTPPRWLTPGQTLDVEIDAIGVLSNVIVDE